MSAERRCRLFVRGRLLCVGAAHACGCVPDARASGYPGADIDLPQLLHGRVVVGGERAIREAGENDAAGGRKHAAVVRVGDVDVVLDLAGERIGDRKIGFESLGLLVGPALPVAGLVAEIRPAREVDAGRSGRNVEQLGLLAVGRGPEIVAAGRTRAHLLGRTPGDHWDCCIPGRRIKDQTRTAWSGYASRAVPACANADASRSGSTPTGSRRIACR